MCCTSFQNATEVLDAEYAPNYTWERFAHPGALHWMKLCFVSKFPIIIFPSGKIHAPNYCDINICWTDKQCHFIRYISWSFCRYRSAWKINSKEIVCSVCQWHISIIYMNNLYIYIHIHIHIYIYTHTHIYIYKMDCVCQRYHKECSTRTCAVDCYNSWKKSNLKSYVRPWFHR